MPEKLLSEMTESQLIAEMERCRKEGRHAYEIGMASQYEVFRQRYYLAKSYLVGSAGIEMGATYGLEENTDLFVVESLRGIMAFGKVLGSEQAGETAFPVGMLVPLHLAPGPKGSRPAGDPPGH